MRDDQYTAAELSGDYLAVFQRGENFLKYFTKEWWAAGGKDQGPVSAYNVYIASVIDRLPANVLPLVERHLLHDASLDRVETSLEKELITMSFSGWDEGFSRKVLVGLCFRDAKDFNVYLCQEDGEKGIGEVGYYEIELLKADWIEMRMLFSSSTEMQVVFRDLTVAVSM